MASDNTNRVARRGPSWAPPATAESPAPSVAGGAALEVAPRAPTTDPDPTNSDDSADTSMERLCDDRYPSPTGPPVGS